jgi:hypothetical protein
MRDLKAPRASRLKGATRLEVFAVVPRLNWLSSAVDIHRRQQHAFSGECHGCSFCCQDPHGEGAAQGVSNHAGLRWPLSFETRAVCAVPQDEGDRTQFEAIRDRFHQYGVAGHQ